MTGQIVMSGCQFSNDISYNEIVYQLGLFYVQQGMLKPCFLSFLVDAVVHTHTDKIYSLNTLVDVATCTHKNNYTR